MKKQQSGFTLIELIMVIVVLGILAAFAIPKFANLGGDARAATLKGAYGSLKSTAALTHSAWLAKNDPTLNEVTVEGTDVAMTLNSGYPTAADNLLVAAGIDANNYQNISTAADTAAGKIVIAPKGVSTTNQANCQVTYTQAAATAGAVPSITITADANLACD